MKRLVGVGARFNFGAHPWTKPTGAFEVDRTHPLGRRLTGLFLMGAGPSALRNYVADIPPALAHRDVTVVNSPSFRVGRYGREIAFAQASSQYIYTDGTYYTLFSPYPEQGLALATTSPKFAYSSLTIATLGATTGAKRQAWSRQDSPWGDLPIAHPWGAESTNTWGATFSAGYGTPKTEDLTSSRTFGADDYCAVVCTLRMDAASAARLYVNGSLDATGSITYSTVSPYMGTLAFGARWQDYTNVASMFFNGRLSLAMDWADYLTPQLAEWVSEEPFCMMRQYERRSYYFVPAGGANIQAGNLMMLGVGA